MSFLDTSDAPDFLARLHPLVLHLPIGLFVALAAVELWRRLRKASPDAGGSTDRSVLVLLIAITAPVAAFTGHELGESGTWGDPVVWHERLGIALGVIGLLLGIAYWRFRKLYGPLLILGVILLVPTSHLGGALTHGEDFFPLPFGGSEQADEGAATDGQAEPKPGDDFASTVGPIFRKYCIKCHGPQKQKAGLALHTYEGLLAGTEEGAVITAGDGAESELIEHLRLPLEHDEHMPPEGKPQPTDDEIAAIVSWIDAQP